MSEASSTDVALFRRLANPDVVDIDVEVKPRSGQAAARTKVREAVEKAIRDAGSAAPSGGASDGPAPPATSSSAFKAAMAEEAAAKAAAKAAPKAAPPEASPGADKGAAAKEDEAPGETADEERPAKRTRLGGGGDSSPAAPSKPAPPASTSRAAAAAEDEGDRLEKQGLLLELRALESKGTKLTRDFGMHDTLAEMEFELNRHISNISTQNAVSFLRDSLRILISGLEIGNAKLGPFLSIDGWAESVTQDMHRYDHSLERIYKRYWRKQQMSPIMELGWLLVGSMLTWHFKAKFFGPPAPSRGPAPRPPASTPPPPQPSSAAASSGPPTGAAAPATARRPTLRPPGASFLGAMFG
jgi:hypothetical protein